MQAAKNEARALPADAEWLLADGRGGYACGTVGDLVRRRYHGLWVARLGDSAKRHMLVAGVDERVAVGDEVLSLLHAHWSGQPGPVAPPVDYAFAPHPFPTFAFRHGAFALERAVQLRPVTEEHGPALLMRWRNLGAEPLRQVELLEQWADRVLEHSAGVKAQPCENRRLQAGMALRACSPRSGGGSAPVGQTLPGRR